MMKDIKIIQVRADIYDAQKIAPLLKQSRIEGYNLVLRLAENWDNGSNRFDKPGEALFAAETEGRWLAIGGRSLDPYLGDPSVIRVRHVYVLPEWRRLGIGAAIMEKILEVPAGMFRRITLRTLNPGARRFYEWQGFEAVDDGPVTHQLMLEK